MLFVSAEMGRWLGLYRRMKDRDLRKATGVPDDAAPAPAESAVRKGQLFLAMLFAAAVILTGSLAVATASAFFGHG